MAVLKNLQQENEEMKRRLAELEAQSKASISFKVSTKGAVSVYGMGRWPVTLYLGQWEMLFSRMDDLKAFIEKNKHRLSVKE